MNVIAFDPGGVTGVAMYRGKTEEFISSEIGNGEAGMFRWLRAAAGHCFSGPVDLYVVEKFTINATTHKKDPVSVYETLNIIGAIHYLGHARGIPVKTQTPAEAKRFATDDKLKALGMYRSTPGGHANDAARHLLTHLASARTPGVLNALRNA